MKLFQKLCLARMEGCWYPEFEPSVEDIDDIIMAISQFAFFDELALGGISLFSLAHGRWRSRPGQPAQAMCPNIRVYGACAVCRHVL